MDIEKALKKAKRDMAKAQERLAALLKANPELAPHLHGVSPSFMPSRSSRKEHVMNAATLKKLEEVREMLEAEDRQKGQAEFKKFAPIADKAKPALYELQKALHKAGYPKLGMRATKILDDIDSLLTAIKLGRLT